MMVNAPPVRAPSELRSDNLPRVAEPHLCDAGLLSTYFAED